MPTLLACMLTLLIQSISTVFATYLTASTRYLQTQAIEHFPLQVLQNQVLALRLSFKRTVANCSLTAAFLSVIFSIAMNNHNPWPVFPGPTTLLCALEVATLPPTFLLLV